MSSSFSTGLGVDEEECSECTAEEEEEEEDVEEEEEEEEEEEDAALRLPFPLAIVESALCTWDSEKHVVRTEGTRNFKKSRTFLNCRPNIQKMMNHHLTCRCCANDSFLYNMSFSYMVFCWIQRSLIHRMFVTVAVLKIGKQEGALCPIGSILSWLLNSKLIGEV
jgi:hypothetical protein